VQLALPAHLLPCLWLTHIAARAQCVHRCQHCGRG
jgi:hypothetical protein